MVLAAGLRECLSGRQRALVKPTATPSVLPGLGGVLCVVSVCESSSLSHQSCLCLSFDAVSRFSFGADTRSSHSLPAVAVRAPIRSPVLRRMRAAR